MVAVKLVDGKGRIRKFGAQDPEMSTIRACLGLCGVIYEITFQVRKLKYTNVDIMLNALPGTTKSLLLCAVSGQG